MNKTLASDWVSLGAAPTFALMAAFTAALGGAPMGGGTHIGGGLQASFCSAGQHVWALDGMAPMYVLMSIFHIAPWWRRVLDTDGSTANGDGRTS